MASVPTRPPITVFTKPWQDFSLDALADLIAELGFDGIELPVRPGFQVEPDRIEETLPAAVSAFQKRGLSIYSVAGDLNLKTATACADAGVPVLRTMLKIHGQLPYMEQVDAFRRTCLELQTAIDGTDTTIGLQNHCDEFVTSAIGLIHAIEPLSSSLVSAVLDMGHTGLDGEHETMAIDIAWDRLSLINLKNAVRYEDGKDALGCTIWNRTWVSGREGYTSWLKVVTELGRRKYTKPICLTCEYKDDEREGLSGDAVIPPLKSDLEFLKDLIDRSYS